MSQHLGLIARGTTHTLFRRDTSRPNGVDIVYFDGGGAHRSTAFALRQALLARAPGMDVRLVHTDEIFPRAPLLGGACSFGIGLYNASIRHERMWLVNLRWAMEAGVSMARGLHRYSVRRVRDYWADGAPRLLISMIPIYNRIFLEALQLERPDARAVVIPCDFEEICRDYWFNPAVNADYLCGTERLQEGALLAGIPSDRVRRIPGMITNETFHAPRATDFVDECRTFGLDPQLPTALISFGGQGSRRMIDIARRLDSDPLAINIVALCGRHERLYDKLSAWRANKPKLIVGFTDEVARYMRLADVFIGKPGPVSIFEALASQLPVVLWDNPAFRVLNDYNLKWSEANGVGIRVRSMDEMSAAVERIVSTPSFRWNTRRFATNATAEAVRIITDVGSERANALFATAQR